MIIIIRWQSKSTNAFCDHHTDDKKHPAHQSAMSEETLPTPARLRRLLLLRHPHAMRRSLQQLSSHAAFPSAGDTAPIRVLPGGGRNGDAAGRAAPVYVCVSHGASARPLSLLLQHTHTQHRLPFLFNACVRSVLLSLPWQTISRDIRSRFERVRSSA